MNPVNNQLFVNSMENFFDTVLKHKTELLDDYRKDKDEIYLQVNTHKMNILDGILKNIVKYRNLAKKEKEITEKVRMKKLVGSK